MAIAAVVAGAARAHGVGGEDAAFVAASDGPQIAPFLYLGAKHGALTAPFDGVHGWHFQNSAPTPAVVRLKLAGYYSLVSAEELKRLGEIADN